MPGKSTATKSPVKHRWYFESPGAYLPVSTLGGLIAQSKCEWTHVGLTYTKQHLRNFLAAWGGPFLSMDFSKGTRRRRWTCGVVACSAVTSYVALVCPYICFTLCPSIDALARAIPRVGLREALDEEFIGEVEKLSQKARRLHAKSRGPVSRELVTTLDII